MVLSILGFACLGHMAVDFIYTLDKSDWLPHKPFKCDMCLTFWLSIWPAVAIYQAEGLFVSAVSAIVADFIFRIKQTL
jgi:hypothetical protein